MRNNKWTVLKQALKEIFSGRAAGAVTVVATVFLCCITMLKFTALEMEWEIPVLKMLSGQEAENWFTEYRREEMAFDDSVENELLDDLAGGETVGIGPTEMEATDKEGGFPEGEKPEGETKPEGTEVLDGTEEPEEAKPGNAEEQEEPEFPYYIRVNRKLNSITIYAPDENGEYTVPYKAMVCSTGLYNATPRGTYHLSTKYLWRELYGGVYGQYATRITGGILFHSVPYYRKTKNSLCTEKYNKLGQQASMGCIRLTVEDAKWIADHCPSGTAVEIFDDDDPGPLGKPEAPKLDLDSPNKGWDPTDMDEENPWHQISEDD